MKTSVCKIVSGGQIGVDRAALDFALANNFQTGGWIPRNRLAEDGQISDKYLNLCETESENSAQRTERNVLDSDATLILSHGKLVGGSKLTLEIAEKYNKPSLHIDFNQLEITEAAEKTSEWLVLIKCKILNVAGPRESEDSTIYEKTLFFLRQLFV